MGQWRLHRFRNPTHLCGTQVRILLPAQENLKIMTTFAIILNIIGIIVCVVWFIQTLIDDTSSAIMAALLFILNLALLVCNIDKKVLPDKFNTMVVETKTPPTVDTLIRHGAVSDTTHVITAIDTKIR